ncbi:fasciclin domain-containing protein [Chitinophaga pendula]|uniref:fasciclin domain-containing protein n=1 Tax=Chitinophaga TaxID=79328 RepID=UPI000BAE7CF2|nr:MULTISPECIES: fasciclin domain-containing protein [Chitinophaga]ASZ11282.1 hypothetical protein CK934_10040 [Chitinophaga sp. MD30]UCJ05718.1 fasciclin domain-containing protein [Chitinophaga pendula]
MNGAKQVWLTLVVVLSIITGCRKKEFVHLPEGQKVPYEEVKVTLKEVLQRPEYQLFNKAWLKSNMSGIIAANGNAPVTLLVPDNAAMRAAGLDDAGIDKTTQTALDTLLMYHTLTARVEQQGLQSLTGNVAWRTFLLNPAYTEGLNGVGSAVSRDSMYRYRHYLGLSQKNELIVEGKQLGTGAPVIAKDGNIWPINKVLRPATKTMLETLKDDGRFTLYLEALQMTDDLYGTLPEIDEYSVGPYLFLSTVMNATIWDIDWEECFCPIFVRGKTQRFSLFAPTDDAFRQAGLATKEDLLALNSRTPPRFQGFTLVHFAVLDSLLGINVWGKQRQMFATSAPPIFYSNDLVPAIMNEYTVSSSFTGKTWQPFECSKDGNGRVQLKAKGSTAEKATIIEGDIPTIQGPIHVIDRLLPPPGFSFTH